MPVGCGGMRSRIARRILVPTVTCLLLLVTLGCEEKSDSDRGIQVRLFRGITQSEELGWRDSVTVGDVLSLEIELSGSRWIYVWNRDAAGQDTLLFPRSQLDNPLEPGRVHHLPGPSGGLERYWTVESRGGDEQLWVVAAPSPLSAETLFGPTGGDASTIVRNTAKTLEAIVNSTARERAQGFVYEEATLEGEETVWVGLIELKGEI
jgi:hypothetical protein